MTPGEYEVIAMADGYEPLAKLIEVTNHGHTGTMHTYSTIYLEVLDLVHIHSYGQWCVMYISVGSRTVPSREVPGRSRDGTGPRDLEGPVVLGLKKSKSPRTLIVALPLYSLKKKKYGKASKNVASRCTHLEDTRF